MTLAKELSYNNGAPLITEPNNNNNKQTNIYLRKITDLLLFWKMVLIITLCVGTHDTVIYVSF